MNKLISFFEVPAADFERAVKFYETILGLKLTVVSCDEEKMAFFPKENGEVTGAISYAPDFKPSADGILLSFNAKEDLNKVLALVEANGGKTIRPKTKIEADNMGYFAIFRDSEGNHVGLYSEG